MMGVTFASVGPMVAMANANPGAGRRAADLRRDHRRRHRLDPDRAGGQPACCASSRRWSPARSSRSSASRLMRVGINWIFGNPVGPTAPHARQSRARRSGWPTVTAPRRARSRRAAQGPGAGVPTVPNPALRADLAGMASPRWSLLAISADRQVRQGLHRQHPVLLGIVVGGVVAAALGMMTFDKVGKRRLVRRRAALPLRHAGVRSGADRSP